MISLLLLYPLVPYRAVHRRTVYTHTLMYTVEVYINRRADEVNLMGPFVIGELRLGSLSGRRSVAIVSMEQDDGTR